MSSRPPSYHEGFSQSRKLSLNQSQNPTLNPSQMEGDICTTKVSGSIHTPKNTGSLPRLKKINSLTPKPEINDRLRKEIDKLKQDLSHQRRCNYLSISIAIVAMLALIITIIILNTEISQNTKEIGDNTREIHK